MFSALALQADVCLGHEAEHFPLIPVEGSTLEHRAPVRGQHVFASATVSRFVPTAQLLREESPREYFILHVVLEEQALQSSGKNMLCLKNNTMFSLSTVLWSSLDHSLTRTPKGYVAGFQLLSLSSEKPRQAQP